MKEMIPLDRFFVWGPVTLLILYHVAWTGLGVLIGWLLWG